MGLSLYSIVIYRKCRKANNQSNLTSSQFLQGLIAKRSPKEHRKLPEFHEQCALKSEAGVDIFLQLEMTEIIRATSSEMLIR